MIQQLIYPGRPSRRTIFVSAGVLFLLCGWGSATVYANQPDQKRRDRYFDHGQVRLMEPKLENGRIVLWWRTPSGLLIRYIPRLEHPGWMVRIRRAIRSKVRFIGVGGRFFQSNKKEGWVYIKLVRRVKRVYRGVRPVKFDGRMPIFMATVMPRHQTDRLFVYKLWGRVNLHQEQYLNKVVCLYGVWFDFQGRKLGLVSQALGIKGKALRSFPQQYQYPRLWKHIWYRRGQLLRYQDSWEKGQQPKLPSQLVPIVSQTAQTRYLQRCQQRVTTVEARATTPLDLLFHPDFMIPAFLPFSLPSHLFSLPTHPKSTFLVRSGL